MPKTLFVLLLSFSLVGCATSKPYFKPRIAERISKINEQSQAENWLWTRWTLEAMKEVEKGLDEWAEHNLDRR